MCCLGGNVIIATAQLFNKNIVIDTKRRPLVMSNVVPAGRVTIMHQEYLGETRCN